jgi:hypothetical protein
LRWPHRWQGVWPLHLILRRLHSLLWSGGHGQGCLFCECVSGHTVGWMRERGVWGLGGGARSATCGQPSHGGDSHSPCNRDVPIPLAPLLLGMAIVSIFGPPLCAAAGVRRAGANRRRLGVVEVCGIVPPRDGKRCAKWIVVRRHAAGIGNLLLDAVGAALALRSCCRAQERAQIADLCFELIHRHTAGT